MYFKKPRDNHLSYCRNSFKAYDIKNNNKMNTTIIIIIIHTFIMNISSNLNGHYIISTFVTFKVIYEIVN